MPLTETEVGLLALLLSALSVAGGKAWGTAKINKLRDEMLKNCQYNFCRPQRVDKEHELESSIKQLQTMIAVELQTLKAGQTRVANSISEINNVITQMGKDIVRLAASQERKNNSKKGKSR